MINMIAIQKAKGGFDDRWINYCQTHNIQYKIVDSYRSDIIDQLKGCDAFMWQFYQGSVKDSLMAKELMFSLEHAGIATFPNFKTAWHFDDKVGQKYLLESIGVSMATAWVFYDKEEAIRWVEQNIFPKVLKLRGGAGSQNVKLVKDKKQAKKLIRKAFGRGFPQYDSLGSIRERWRLFRLGKTPLKDIFEGIARILIPPTFAKVKGRERGYIYFQDYIAGNDHDIRVVVIDDKAFAVKRMVRKNDFRASGSGIILYDKKLFKERIIKHSFDIAGKIQSQCVALDFVHDNDKPLLVEISYGFVPKGYDLCPGFWDKDLTWHEGKFNPYGWMVENLIKDIENQRTRWIG